MRVLGVDPGTAIVGYGLLEFDGVDFRHLEHGTITTESGLALSTRLQLIHRGLGELINRTRPSHAAVEELFFSRNAKTAFAVGHARGVILLTAAEEGLEVFEYTPMQVKQALVGYGGAEKQQVQQMVRMLLALDDIPRPDDAADALAVAVTHCNSYHLSSLAGQAGWRT